MSLSSWLRDYLYIPLGGNRRGDARTYANLMLTMLLGGLWHGANWTFVIWGGLHGAYLAFERAVLARVRWWNAAHPFATALRVVVTFHLVCLAWVFFRARDLAGAHAVLANLARPEADANGLGGLALLLGAFTRCAALAVLVFTVVATLIGHRCWEIAEPAARRMQQSHFAKNLAIMGGILLLFVTRAGRFSVDGWRGRR